jgi:hypothetical protein
MACACCITFYHLCLGSVPCRSWARELPVRPQPKLMCLVLPLFLLTGVAQAQSQAVANAVSAALTCGCQAGQATAQALAQAVVQAGGCGCVPGVQRALAGQLRLHCVSMPMHTYAQILSVDDSCLAGSCLVGWDLLLCVVHCTGPSQCVGHESGTRTL